MGLMQKEQEVHNGLEHDHRILQCYKLEEISMNFSIKEDLLFSFFLAS
jgi:hypothetical protein